jgi:acetylornithine/N-succinyldiaminopimelate aminotransferase
MKMTIQELEKSSIIQTYMRSNLTLVSGKGTRVWDDNGREYLDFVAGIAVCNLGHCHEAVTNAICEQAGRLVHTSNLYYTEPQVELAKLLTDHCFADRVFFCNSGAEANEAAIKLARKYSLERRGEGHHRIVATHKSFHGRTMATLTATGQEKVKIGFQPLLEGFTFVPFNDLKAADAALDETVCAFLVEPIQGEGGVNLPSSDYLQGLKDLCHKRGALLIFDEVQVGMGRTGRLFAYQNYGVEPDIMTLAKAIANGLPMGVMLTTEEVASAFSLGSHASTFGGTPLVSSAAIAVIKELLEGAVLSNCLAMGARLEQGLKRIMVQRSDVVDVRGMGLIWAMEMNRDCQPIVQKAQEQALLINRVQEKVLRFTPPLIVTASEIDRMLHILEKVLDES